MRAALVAILLTLFGAILHEGGHALTAKALGYDVIMTLNKVSTVSEATEAHAHMITAGGPSITILLALVGFIMALAGSRFGLSIVATAFLYRLMAMIISLQNPNDEMRLSLDLDLGQWIVPSIVVGTLLVMTIISAVRTRTGPLYLFLTWLGFTVTITAIVLTEQYQPALTF